VKISINLKSIDSEKNEKVNEIKVNENKKGRGSKVKGKNN
jgi:hypothetical protein